MGRKRKTDEQKIDELLNGRGTASEMAAAIIREFGGMTLFAREVHTCYSETENAVAKQRIILGVINLNTQADRLDAPPVIEDFEDDELAELVDLVDASQQQATKTAAPATSKPPADAATKEKAGRSVHAKDTGQPPTV
jgi:hypothetical protein